ncbi:MBL fold metallo-hydrolase [Patescibacteria group bacterium]|nr:MBL fold metallo-hydrolase [Patescibacteria group bacterium]
MEKIQVKILRHGEFKWLKKNHCRAWCTTTLIIANRVKIIVDPGNFSDAVKIKKLLAKNKLTPADINYVVNSHAHADHIGANFLFTKAVIVTSDALQKKDEFVFYDNTKPYTLVPGVKIIATPGHSAECCTVLAETEKGIVAVAGDLFWLDEEAEYRWAEYPNKLKANRQLVLKMANYIIPGHGRLLHVKK